VIRGLEQIDIDERTDYNSSRWWLLCWILGLGFNIWCSQWLLLRLWVDGSVTDISLVQMDEIMIRFSW